MIKWLDENITKLSHKISKGIHNSQKEFLLFQYNNYQIDHNILKKLGDVYFDEKDYFNAIKYYENALQYDNNENIYCRLGYIFYFENIDYEKAYDYFIKGFEHGSIISAFYLGLLYFKGKCIQKNINKGINLLKLTAESDINTYNMFAQYNLGLIYETGIEVDRDIETSLYWYKLSAKNNNEKAKYRISKIYLEDNYKINREFIER